MYYRTLLKFVFAIALMAASSARATVQVFACEPEWAALATEDRRRQGGGHGGHQRPAGPALYPGPAQPDRRYSGSRPGDLFRRRLEAGWLPVLLGKGNNPKVQPPAGYLLASDYVNRLEIPAQLDRAQGDIHAEGNPHIQTDPRNIALVANVIAERLQQVDPGNAQNYQQGLAAFQDKWGRAIAAWERQAAPLRGKAVVPHHKSWVYLENWLGLVEVATLEPKPGVPPSAAHLQELLVQLQASPAGLIIRAPYQDPQASEWLTKQTGIPNAVLPFTVGGTPEADNLYSLFDVTLRTLLDNMVPKNAQ
ncbi:MAG: zinc ABC transporter substrate-binding protein [Halioglobus sp.]